MTCGGFWKTGVVRILRAFTITAFCIGVPTILAHAQNTTQEFVPRSEVAREVARATFVSAATLAAVQRQSDADLRRQRFEIDELRTEVDALRASSSADLATLEALRNTLAEREAAFVGELASRDRA